MPLSEEIANLFEELAMVEGPDHPLLNDEQRVDWKLERVRNRLAENLKALCRSTGDQAAQRNYAERVLRTMFEIPLMDAPFALNLQGADRVRLLDNLLGAWQLTKAMLLERAA
jgi:hypothetical protein